MAAAEAEDPQGLVSTEVAWVEQAATAIVCGILEAVCVSLRRFPSWYRQHVEVVRGVRIYSLANLFRN